MVEEAGPSSIKLEQKPPEQPVRQISHLHMIQQRKQQVYSWERDKKLLKLAIYSTCQQCQCLGWKAPQQKASTLASLSDPCHLCTHELSHHNSHLSALSDLEINKLLSMVVDVENIYKGMHKEADEDNKAVYFCLFKLLKRCISEFKQPIIEGPLGKPPFEAVSIAKGVTNFVLHKFRHLPSKEWQQMYDLSKMFLHSLNHWSFETPTARKMANSSDDISAYKVNYARWLVFCHVPAFCDSLPHFETANAFGRTMLRAVFKTVKKQFMDKCNLEKDRMTPEKRIVLTHFPNFLNLIEEEIYASSSPIWDPDFKHPPPACILESLERRKLAEQAAASKKGSPGSCQQQIRSIGVPLPDYYRSIPLQGIEGDVPQSLVAEVIESAKNEIPGPNVSSSNIVDQTLFKEPMIPYDMARAQEKEGTIKVVLVSNSLTSPVNRQKMLWLIELKSLFSHLLPKMPVNYITRLVFDPKHKVLALLKNKQIIGGICFRPFFSQGFSEIVFCAIQDNEHLNGYGTQLMHHLKEYHLRVNIYHFLTFADEHAKGYFRKQGFNSEIGLQENIYKDYIKYYDEAILMHCELNPFIVYTDVLPVVRTQKEICKLIMKRKSAEVNKIYPGMSCFRDGVHPLQVESVPGINETGWRPPIKTTRISRLREDTPETLHKTIKSVKAHRAAWPFLKPVTKVPDYYDLIKYPMGNSIVTKNRAIYKISDLKTMSDRLKTGYYTTRRLFIADMQRIFVNCRIYNLPETEYYSCANILEKFFQFKMEEFNLWDN